MNRKKLVFDFKPTCLCDNKAGDSCPNNCSHKIWIESFIENIVNSVSFEQLSTFHLVVSNRRGASFVCDYDLSEFVDE